MENVKRKAEIKWKDQHGANRHTSHNLNKKCLLLNISDLLGIFYLKIPKSGPIGCCTCPINMK